MHIDSHTVVTGIVKSVAEESCESVGRAYHSCCLTSRRRPFGISRNEHLPVPSEPLTQPLAHRHQHGRIDCRIGVWLVEDDDAARVSETDRAAAALSHRKPSVHHGLEEMLPGKGARDTFLGWEHCGEQRQILGLHSNRRGAGLTLGWSGWSIEDGWSIIEFRFGPAGLLLLAYGRWDEFVGCLITDEGRSRDRSGTTR